MNAPVLPIFTALETYGKIKHEEMFEIFNMGIGFIFITSPEQSDNALKCLRAKGEKPIIIGKITAAQTKVVIK